MGASDASLDDESNVRVVMLFDNEEVCECTVLVKEPYSGKPIYSHLIYRLALRQHMVPHPHYSWTQFTASQAPIVQYVFIFT